MEQDLTFGIIAFTSLVAVYNPLSAAPIFVGLTAEDTPAERRGIAVRGVLTSVIVMFAFAVAGVWILRFFGITAEAFQIAGGVIFFGIGSDMLQAKRSRVKYGTPFLTMFTFVTKQPTLSRRLTESSSFS